MKLTNIKLLTLVIAGITIYGVQTGKGQPGSGKRFMRFEKEILLPGVKGRIDHIDFNLTDQVAYVAALGNNSLEIVDIKSGRVTGSIKGLDEPQGVERRPRVRQGDPEEHGREAELLEPEDGRDTPRD